MIIVWGSICLFKEKTKTHLPWKCQHRQHKQGMNTIRQLSTGLQTSLFHHNKTQTVQQGFQKDQSKK